MLLSSNQAFGQNQELLSDEGWVQKKGKHNIKIYSKKLANYKVKAFKAVGRIEENTDAVYNTIMDIEKYSEWYPDCAFGRVLQEDGQKQTRQIVYDLPWPFDARGAVMHVVSRREGDSILIEMINAADYLPEQKKIVRIPRTEGYWLLMPEEGGTMVTYCAVGEAPGVPTWVVNLFVFDGPIEALNNLRQMAKKEEYKFTPEWWK